MNVFFLALFIYFFVLTNGTMSAVSCSWYVCLVFIALVFCGLLIKAKFNCKPTADLTLPSLYFFSCELIRGTCHPYMAGILDPLHL